VGVVHTEISASSSCVDEMFLPNSLPMHAHLRWEGRLHTNLRSLDYTRQKSRVITHGTAVIGQARGHAGMPVASCRRTWHLPLQGGCRWQLWRLRVDTSFRLCAGTGAQLM